MKHQRTQTQRELMQVHKNRPHTGRRNTHIATLATRIETDQVNLKNCFDMDMVVHPTPDEDNPMCKLHYDAVADIEES